MIRARTLAAMLLMISGVTHVLQLTVYPASFHVAGGALFGIAYFIIGYALLKPCRTAIWWGAILPGLGGTLGIIRFLNWHINPFSVFHVLIDFIVVPICIREIRKRPRD